MVLLGGFKGAFRANCTRWNSSVSAASASHGDALLEFAAQVGQLARLKRSRIRCNSASVWRQFGNVAAGYSIDVSVLPSPTSKLFLSAEASPIVGAHYGRTLCARIR